LEETWTTRFLANAEIFARYNRRRIDYLRNYLPEKKRDVFDLIPLLLHEDSPDLPGNVSVDTTPCGVSCFCADGRTRELAARYFPKFVPKRQAKPRMSIVFLALMGSAGTVAFTRQSDMDYWVGVDSQHLDAHALNRLWEKLHAIEAWAEETAALEVHFFVTELEKLRTDDYGELSQESCGTALGKLLKDEFYRTGILVQGKAAYYWVMPSATTDADYAFNIARLSSGSEFPAENYVDLGNVHTIGQAEYFGAALWHLLKGLREPFKSVLKVAVVDKYSTEGRTSVPLCEQYKAQLLSTDSFDALDPYLFMLEALRSFYDRQGQPEIRVLIEECFLVKNLLTTGIAQLEDKARTKFFMVLGGRWGWRSEKLAALACYREWDAAKRTDLNRRVIGFLVETYQRIRERTRNGNVRISERDLTVLGKKLECFFDSRRDKVPREPSMYHARDIADIEMQELPPVGSAAPMWRLGVRICGASAGRYQMVRNVPNPLVACAWCCVNQFYNGRQRLVVQGRTRMTVKETAGFMRFFSEFFPVDVVDSLDVSALLDERRITHVCVAPNWDDPDWNRTLKSLLVFYRNSLGEIYFDTHSGTDTLDWLTREVLLSRIGKDHLRALKWKTYVAKGDVTSAKRISDVVSRHISELMTRVFHGR